MPRADFEALEARCQARRDRGDDSANESTVANDDDNEDGGLAIQVGQDDLADFDLEGEMNEEVDTIEASICRATTSIFMRVLLFTQGAAESLYDAQMITTFETRELDDYTIKETCKAIKKPVGGTLGHQISEISVTRFKLFTFWARHMWRTCRSIDDWTDISWDDVSILKNQKTLEDNLQVRKAPEPPVMTLDL